MNACDLITMAGRAAGVDFPEHRQHYGITVKKHDGTEIFMRKWNPLEHEEDAQWLKNRFGITTRQGDEEGKPYVQAHIKGSTCKLYLRCAEHAERSMRHIITKIVAEYGARDER